jgi:hypothetical protein
MKTTQRDARAALARAEQVIDTLRTRYICAGWALDEEGAAYVLRYYRRWAAGSRSNQGWQRCGHSFIHIPLFTRAISRLDRIGRSDRADLLLRRHVGACHPELMKLGPLGMTGRRNRRGEG